MSKLLEIKDCTFCPYFTHFYELKCKCDKYVYGAFEFDIRNPIVPDFCPLPDANPWISVEDRLSNIETRVRVIVKGYTGTIFEDHDKYVKWTNPDRKRWAKYYNTVTHWQNITLPEENR